MEMDATAWIALGTLLGGVIIYAVIATIYVSNKDAAAHARISAAETSFQTKLGNVETSFQTKIAGLDVTLREKAENLYNLAVTKAEAAMEREAKSRHDLANQVQIRTGELMLDIKNLDRRINELIGNMATKDDLVQLGARLETYFNKLDGNIEKLRDEVKHS